jgi:aryl-alcohol dehydrogenase-like predicted oxidoreductase
VGSSNFPGWKIAQLSETANARRQFGLVSEQSLYNLIERRAELEVLPACREYGVGMIVWSPLAGGLLAGPSGDKAGRRLSKQAKDAALLHQMQLSQFERLCQELGEAPSVVALSWLLQQSGVTAAIVGPGSRVQLSNVLQSPDLRVDDDTVARIDAIFPPCGPAPEAYAW